MNKHAGRIRIIALGVIFFALLLVVKLYYVQIVSGEAFNDRADRQYVRPVGGLFDRGTIFFSAKDGTLMAAAALKTGYTLAINPKILKDPATVYGELSKILPIERAAFLEKAAKQNDPYEEIAKRIDQDKAKQIDALGIKGVNIYKEKWRYYPGETLASQILGFVGFKGDDYSGRYGLENYYENVLMRNSQNVYVNVFAEIFSDVHKVFTDTGTIEGDIVTTIEPNVQSELESQLKKISDSYQSKLTGGVVIDPKTGEIFAMGSYPTFNPNSYQTVKNFAVLSNPLVQNVYEMGSIVKPLAMAAGLDAGVVTAASTYFDKGSLTMNSRTIYNYDKRARGQVNMQEVLNQSLNTGMAHVVQKLGNQKFSDYMYKFGLGSLTGIDLPSEVKGLTDNLKTSRDIEHVTAAFGQGIALSPIETVRALAALGNGGTLITPHVAKRIEYKVGFSKTLSYPEGARVLKPETSREISRMLTTVVDEALLEGSVKMDRYSIAAKTGTAQIAKPGGGYYDDRYLHSFFGYFPAKDPKFLVFLYTVEPQGVSYASHTLTEPFITIAKYLINYYELPPDR